MKRNIGFRLTGTVIQAIFPIVLIFLVSKVYSQGDSTSIIQKNFSSIAGSYQFGNILPTTDFVKGDNLLGKPMQVYRAYTVKMLWQNPGYKNWQKVYRAPYYGAGLTFGNFYNPDEVGYPVSVFGILGIPIKRWNKLELYSEFQFGIASNWKHYDSIENPKNLVVGGALTVHLNIGINAFYHLTENVDLGGGVNFIHYSNGGFERPNRGFNIYAPSVEIKYHFSDRPDFDKVNRADRINRPKELYFMLGYGDYQINEHELDTNYFAVIGLSAVYSFQANNAFRLGAGTDLNYWMGLTALPDGTIGPRSFKNLTLGFVFQPELCIDRLTLVGGFGIYAVHLDYGNFKQTYQRLGVRYDVYKNLSLGVNVRAINFMLAEFLEFNLGYRINLMKS